MILNKFSAAIQHRVLNKYSVFNPLIGIRKSLEKLYSVNDINICYNKFIRKSYDPSKQNILIAIESPGLIEHYKWIDPKMKFAAEISFQNYFNLANYLCPRTIYANNDNFVDMPESIGNYEKPDLVSMVYSDRKIISGHQFRYEIAEKFKDDLHLFGKGTGRFLMAKSDSLNSYMFQIVVENGKYPEYVTEKFFDCIKMGTIPIYWGGEEAVRKMGFDLDGILFFNEMDELSELLSSKVNADFYSNTKPSLNRNWERLKEIRNEDKLLLALHSVKNHYHHTTSSYQGVKKRKLNLGF